MEKTEINASWELRKGDIFEQPDIDIIIHQCNCCHCMGGGIAGVLATRYPEVLEADKTTPYKEYDKMGTNVHVLLKEGKDSLTTVVNMYAQFYPGHFFNKFDYHARLAALKSCLQNVYDTYKDKEVKIGVPYLIGCGISGLREEDVLDVFSDTFPVNKGMTCKLVFVELP